MAVEIKLLRDGTGRVRIHWFIHDEAGPITTHHSTIPSVLGPIKIGGAVGRIACQPGLTEITPQPAGANVRPVCHTNDIRAATCPECLATPEAKAMLANLEELVEG